jgi:hypothetical protein
MTKGKIYMTKVKQSDVDMKIKELHKTFKNIKILSTSDFAPMDLKRKY